MNLIGSSSNSQKRRKQGFALILTLALISFVFLLVITLVNQVRMEFSFTESRQNQILAKAHARMGMMIAIGEIQKHLGPDTRVSSTADIYDERLSFSENSSSVDLNEDGVVNTIPLGQRMWTGVWKNRGGWAEAKLATRPLPENRDDGNALTESWSVDSSYDPHPAVECAWLVSGNEGWKKKLAVLSGNNVVREFVEVPDGIIIDDEGARVVNQPLGGTYGKAENPWADHKLIVKDVNRSNAYYHPILSVAEDDQKAWLLKNPVLGEDFDPQNPAHQNNWEQYLVGEPVVVPKTAIHDTDDTDSGLARNQSQVWDERKGSYAYWVADEGVKAKINIAEPVLTNETKLKVASSPNIGEGSFGINLTTQKEEKRKDLLTTHSLDELLGIENQNTINGKKFHTMTTDSYSVLSDVRTGGLKRDLSLALALEKTSKSWVKDFDSDFIFRDRVRALKNIPLDPSSKRNLWYMSNDETVDDPHALLAGPPWAILRDYHNTSAIDGAIEIKAPDQFPRSVGDNALIFGRTAPESPRNAFLKTRDAYPFFNCFSSSVRQIRPEPKNHPILPVFVKGRLSFCPLATESPGNFCLGIYPSISLWNPYDTSMLISNDLFVEIPFEDNSCNLKITQVDFKEYDLYRKWWAWASGDFNASMELKRTHLSEIGQEFYTGYIKDWKEPWGLYSFAAGLNKYDSREQQEGLINHFLNGSGSPAFDSNIDQGDWNSRTPRSSLYGIKMEGNVFYHENPRDGIDDPTFTFHSMVKESFSFGRLILKVTNYESSGPIIIEPGEVVTFACFALPSGEDIQTNQPIGSKPELPSLIEITRRPSGTVEKGYIWDSGFVLDKDACAFQIKLGSLIGYQDSSAEKFNALGRREKSGWASSDQYKNPQCFSLWKGHPDNEDSSVLTRLTDLSQLGPDSDIMVSTNDFLHNSFNESASGEYEQNLFGFGWEVSLRMPGEINNDRIPLVEFNPRALVHSQQHGQGRWLKGTEEFIPSHFKDTPQLRFTPQPMPVSYSIDGLSFGFNQKNNDYEYKSPKNTPDIYKPLDIRPEKIFKGNINSTEITDPDKRADLLFFEKKSTGNYNFSYDDNPDFWNEPKLSAENGQERIGFFTEEKETDSPYSGQFSDSSHAVLFEIPKGKILSLFQYRHANFNNYLHGPTYALGNSYATTQVARHRSWGRVQNINMRPTSEGGMTSVSKNLGLNSKIEQYYIDLFGKQLANLKGLNSFISWSDIDPEQGFAAWRSGGSAQLNHQNTTLDYSYYLNRALLDGFFLSGSSGPQDFSREENEQIGQKYRPFLWKSDLGTPSNFQVESKAIGNHRLHGYFRKGSWKDGVQGYGSKSEELGFSSKNDSDYRYQSLAGDLLLDGGFNINSTSIDAWKAQLSSLRGNDLENATVDTDQTPLVRFISEPSRNAWNDLRTLSDEEISDLAESIVKQIKLRGPFLSMADFINRRLALGPINTDSSKAKGTRINFVQIDLDKWVQYPEDRYSAQGLRGVLQAAIAESGLNDEGEWNSTSWIPKVPIYRYDLDTGNLYDTSFGLKASALSLFNEINPSDSDERLHYLNPQKSYPRNWGTGSRTSLKLVHAVDYDRNGELDSIRDDKIFYPATSFGEAPENLLAVEHLATGANKPGWVMQSDLFSPLIPVTTSRSDTFVIRVQGDTSSPSPANAWIELVVQRTPDYVKPDLDAPHHRPHEPFKDVNLNGFWDNGRGEHWIDLNQNADVFDQPDLPGVGELGKQKDYRDGLLSDLKLNMDPQEEDIESQSQISYLGTNQRFGRKFKIVRFRWLRANEV
jgi:hypothetical protein